MNDITDQDRRAARSWAKNWQGDQDDDTSAAARVILATVDAPEPTLAEAVEAWAEKHFSGVVGTGKHELFALAARAAQMEHDLAEARAEAERLTAERDKARYERDEARDDANALDEELAGAESEVDRLTAERDRLEAAQYLSDGSAWGGPVREPTVQKGAESNAESLNPADVPPGEAWIVECRGERRTAVKDRADDVPWNTIDANGRHVYKSNENITLITSLVPAPRVITNPDELDQAKLGTIIQDESEYAWQRIEHRWCRAGSENVTRSDDNRVELPATVLWEPEV